MKRKVVWKLRKFLPTSSSQEQREQMYDARNGFQLNHPFNNASCRDLISLSTLNGMMFYILGVSS